jgi:hypothetical protein
LIAALVEFHEIPKGRKGDAGDVTNHGLEGDRCFVSLREGIARREDESRSLKSVSQLREDSEEVQPFRAKTIPSPLSGAIQQQVANRRRSREHEAL